jgi:hypothetical protein
LRVVDRHGRDVHPNALDASLGREMKQERTIAATDVEHMCTGWYKTSNDTEPWMNLIHRTRRPVLVVIKLMELGDR